MKTEMDVFYTVAKASYAYKPDNLRKEYPVFAIELAGAFRPTEKFGTVSSVFRFIIHHFVLYANKEQSWTKQNADDALDDMELAWANFLNAKKANRPTWQNIQILGPSIILDKVDMAGERYIDEQIPVEVMV
jgi:hypothetical protein